MDDVPVSDARGIDRQAGSGMTASPRPMPRPDGLWLLAVVIGMGAWVTGSAVWVASGHLPVLLEAPMPVALSFAGAFLAALGIGLHLRRAALRRARRERDLAAQLMVVQAAAARLSRESSVAAVGRAVVEETGRIIDYHNARAYVIEPPDAVVPIAFEGRVGEYEKVDFDVLRTSVGVGFTGWVALHGVPIRVDDANADPRGATIPGTADVDESMLVVPMRYDERVVGVITLSKLGLAGFSDEDLRLLTILADQAATAIETARLLERANGLADEMRRIVEMSRDLTASLDPRAVANLIARHVAAALDVAECAISLWDRFGDRIVTMGYHPLLAEDEMAGAFALADFPETRRVLEEQVISIVQVDDPAADAAEVALLRTDDFKSLMMLPLVAKGASIGLVELISPTRLELDSTRVELARTMANEAAMALENARLYDTARDLADHDPLTGFLNHRSFHERLGEEIVRSGRSRDPLALLMVDLDDFKLVNDTFGHQLGDRVLVFAADLIRSTLRASDVAARYGGDEFAVILPATDLASGRAAADRIEAVFGATAFHADGRGSIPVGATVGIAVHPLDGRGGPQLIAAADVDLYRVKGERNAAAPSQRRAASSLRSSDRSRAGAAAAQYGSTSPI
jgi:diguanylate cyclase (GGDEF)-like protein